MPQNLISDLTINLGPGATVTVPHGLTAPDNTPLIPFEVRPDRGTPILVTATTATDVTFNNPDAAPQTAIFRAWRYHSEIAPNNTPSLRWQGAAAGGGGGGTQYAYLWQPNGGVNAGNQYETFSAIDALASLIPGKKLVVVDTALSGGVAAFDANIADMSQYQIIGRIAPPNRPTMSVPAGVTLTGLPTSIFGASLRMDGGSVVLQPVFVCFTQGADFSSTVPGSVISSSGGPVPFGIIALQFSQIGDDVNPVIDLVNAADGINITFGQAAQLRENALTDGGGSGATATLELQDASPTVSRVQPGFTAANLSYTYNASYQNIVAEPVSLAGPAAPLPINCGVALINSTGGVQLLLPPISSVIAGNAGLRYLLKNVTNNNDPITLVPNGGDTIESVNANYVFNTAPGGFSSLWLQATSTGWWIG